MISRDSKGSSDRELKKTGAASSSTNWGQNSRKPTENKQKADRKPTEHQVQSYILTLGRSIRLAEAAGIAVLCARCLGAVVAAAGR